MQSRAWSRHVENLNDLVQPGAGPNDEERGQPHVPIRASLARSSLSVSFAFGLVATTSMKKFERALKAGVKGFADAFAPARYRAGGTPVLCPHCKGELFREHEALLNTTAATLVNLDWLDKSGTALLCENCGLIQWYAKKPDRL